MRYCSNCGSLNDTDAKFCAKCGKQLGVDIVPEPEAKIEEVVAEAANEAPEVLETPAETAETAAESIEESAEEVADAVAEASEETVEAAEEVIDTPAAEETPCCAAEAMPEENPEIQPAPVAEPVYEAPAAPCEPKLAKGQKYDRPIKGRVFGIIGFILGLDSLIWCWVPVYNIGSLICSIIALIFTGISRKNTSLKLAKVGKIFAVIALIASIVSIILFTGLVIFGIMAIFKSGSLSELSETIRNALNEISITIR